MSFPLSVSTLLVLNAIFEKRLLLVRTIGKIP